MSSTITQKKRDRYLKIKYAGYSLATLSDSYTFTDLIRYAKFYLASKTKRLLKDPIWDEYTAEELLTEFYAHQCVDNKEFLTKFEEEIGHLDGAVDDFAKWADKKIAEEAKIRDKLIGDTESKIEFSPDTMGDN